MAANRALGGAAQAANVGGRQEGKGREIGLGRERRNFEEEEEVGSWGRGKEGRGGNWKLGKR